MRDESSFSSIPVTALYSVDFLLYFPSSSYLLLIISLRLEKLHMIAFLLLLLPPSPLTCHRRQEEAVVESSPRYSGCVGDHAANVCGIYGVFDG